MKKILCFKIITMLILTGATAYANPGIFIIPNNTGPDREPKTKEPKEYSPPESHGKPGTQK